MMEEEWFREIDVESIVYEEIREVVINDYALENL